MIELWFGVPVFFKDFDNEVFHKELDNAMSNVEIKSAEKIWNDTAQTSFTYSSNNKLLDDCPELSRSIVNTMSEYLTYFNLENATGVGITGSWINVSERGQFQHYHDHAGDDISGVFYHQATGSTDEGEIVFKSPAPGIAQSRLMSGQSNKAYYPPKKGRLMLFPSVLEHAVLPNKTDLKRISVSFNASIIWK